MSTIGLIANPASGKDVRRLVARASVFDNQEKRAIVRRVLAGIAAVAADCSLAYLDDPHGIVRGALEDADGALRARPVSATVTASALDSTSAASSMRDLGCAVLITLGGDGTNRAVVGGWPDAPLIPLSTGTNNVFPNLTEATVAGAAAGLVASGRVPLAEVAERHKLIHVRGPDQTEDLALIDAVLSAQRFVGARALLDADAVRAVLLSRADPAAIGMTALGGVLRPLTARESGGLLIRLGPGGQAWRVAIAPGHYRDVSVLDCRPIAFDQPVTFEGPGSLAFDGERERTLGPGHRAQLHLSRTGPWVVDIARTLTLAARHGLFRLHP